MSTAEEIAKAAAPITDLFNKLAGPLAEELGLMMADKAKLYRLKNWIGIVQKAEKMLRDAGMSPNAVPPRLFLPILEASSLEDDETLQELWAGLLSSASQNSDDLSPSFIETLKQLTPGDAKFLKQLHALSDRFYGHADLARAFYNSTAYGDEVRDEVPKRLETLERLGIVRRRFDVELRTKKIGVHGVVVGNVPEGKPKVKQDYEFTRYGVEFVVACNGPAKPTETTKARSP